MIYRIFPQKDTFISNRRKSGVPQTASNFGASEILHLFKVAPLTGVGGALATASFARVLTQFDLSAIADLTASRKAPSAGISYRLRLADASHDETIPTSYDVEAQALTQDWDEGSGHDVEDFADKGYANWDRAKSSVFWSAAGASGSGPIAVFHFDSGHEDLSVDVTNIVNGWLTGSVVNRGFLVRVSSTLEANGLDYFVKKFHSRETHFPDRLPYLEASWDDSVRDDRNNFVFDYTGSLYLYNVVRGQLTDLSGVGTGNNVLTVRIVDASGTIKTVSGSHTGLVGIYSASFAIATGSHSGSLFRDMWSSGSKAIMTGSFVPTDDFSRVALSPTQYFVGFPRAKNAYESDELVRFDVFVRGRDYNPAHVLTASSDSNGSVITKGYYRIVNDRTDEVVVPFGTGTVETTRLSYDQRGNYFNFYVRSLPAEQVYRVALLFDVDGQRQLVDPGFKFKVV